MTPDILGAVIGSAQVIALTGIFYRLGGLTKAHDDFSARLNKLETKRDLTCSLH